MGRRATMVRNLIHLPGKLAGVLSLAALVFVFPAAVNKSLASEPVPRPDAEKIEFFEKKIRPVLVDNCYSCHSHTAKELEGGLHLDTRAGMLKGGDSGPAIVPGKPEASNLLKALRYGEDFAQMPPKGKLPPAVIADFQKWVATGASDPRIEGPPTKSEPAMHWAFQPPRRVPPPPVRRADWPRNEIDRFVLRVWRNAIFRQHRTPTTARSFAASLST